MSTFAFNGAGEIPVVPIVPDKGGLLRDRRALAAFIVAEWQGAARLVSAGHADDAKRWMRLASSACQVWS